MRTPRLITTPSVRSPVTYEITSGVWQSDAAVKAQSGGWLIDRTLYSRVFKRNISISVLVPATYSETSVNYPVNWHLHGLGGSGNRYGASWYPAVYGNAVRADQCPEHITVFPNGLDYSMWIDDDQGALLVEQYLMKDVIPWVRANYRTRTEAKYNAISGFSMGGRAATYYGFKYPNMFGCVASYGAPYYDMNADFKSRSDVLQWGPFILSADQSYTDSERDRWNECSPQGWLTAHSIKPAIRINYGEIDNLTLTLNETFKTLLTSSSIPFSTGTPVPSVAHSASGCWTSTDGGLMMAFIGTTFRS